MSAKEDGAPRQGRRQTFAATTAALVGSDPTPGHRQEPAPEALFAASIGSYGDTNFMLPGDEGRGRRDDGVARADRMADAGWKAEADRIIGNLAATGRDFCADDLHDAGLSAAINSAAYGGRLLAAARAGTIAKVGYTTSTRPGRRAGATAVWRGVR